MAKQDEVRADITQRLIDSIEKGVMPWRMPWLQHGAPRNAVSQKCYRGVNVWNLSLHMNDNGFSLPLYGTFNQWKGAGFSVKPRPATVPGGLYGCPIVFYSIVSKTAKDAAPGDKPDTFPIMKFFSVFNVDQVTGPDDKMAALRAKWTPKTGTATVGIHDDAERLITASGASITYGGDRAAYKPGEDAIILPNRSQFSSVQSYYGTAFHELAHWTGNEKRLNRKFARYGSEAYAVEELVAEMAGVFTLSAVGLPVTNALENHASYVASWLKVLKSDTRAIFTASSAAQAASDYLLKLAGMLEEGQEQPAE